MSVLGALKARHDREAATAGGSVSGFAPAKIHFTLVLSREGDVVTVERAARDGKGKRLLKEPLAPQMPKRTVAVVSGAFWDKTSYVLGKTAIDATAPPQKQARDAARCVREHAAFKTRHEALLASSDDAGCHALLAFLRGWDPSRYDSLDHAAEMLDQNVAFRLDGESRFLHDRPGAQAALAAETAAPADDAGEFCIVTGAVGPIARLHPSIRGVPGAQSAGAALVSFNLDAFNSYGRTQGFNAPVSEAVAFAYGRALNDLLSAEIGRDEKGRPRYANRIGIGEDTVVFWADTSEAEAIVRGAFALPPPDDRTETAMVRSVMERIERGTPIDDASLGTEPSTKVYVLGLSPNAARLSVRFWLESTLGAFASRFQEHWDDMRIAPPARKSPPPVWALLHELAPRGEIDKGMKQLAGEWLRAVVTGGDYPGSLLAQALMRVRAERKAPPLRVAVIKAVLTRRARKAWQESRRKDPAHLEWKDRWMSLNRDEAHLGYRLGRLFAVLEAAQYAGLGRRVNAGVRDKYFGSASATPRHVFPTLLKGVQDHLSAARKRNRAGRANRLDGEIREILDGLPSPGLFPASLDPEAQGAFVVGFYHQDADLRVPRAKDETIEPPEGDASTDEDGEP